MRYPPLRYYLEKVLRGMGGISHWAAKRKYLILKIRSCKLNGSPFSLKSPFFSLKSLSSHPLPKKQLPKKPGGVLTKRKIRGALLGHGPNTVSESTVSNTELSEFFCPHRVSGRKLSEFLSAHYLCDKANSPSFSQNSPSLPPKSQGK